MVSWKLPREAGASRGRQPTHQLTNSSPFQCVPDVEEDLEIQLLAPIGEIERRHLGFVARRLRALECFAVHVIEVGEDAFAGARHAVLLEGLRGEPGRFGARPVELLLGGLEQIALSGLEEIAPGGKGIVH